MFRKSLAQPEKRIILGIPLLFILGSLLHFMFQLFQKNPVIGIFAPVNESIWEHSKMMTWPITLWWVLNYFLLKKRATVDLNKWFTGALSALVSSLVVMPMIYYFYTSAFGVELLWVDILILLFSVSVGQLFGMHIYRHSQGINAMLSLLIIFLVLLIFALFTFFPPTLPLFQDGPTGNYGIAA